MKLLLKVISVLSITVGLSVSSLSLEGQTGGGEVQIAGSSDVGAQINAAVAAMPASGGSLHIPSLRSGQCYSFTIPIVINKQVILHGDGPATCLDFVGSGTAVTMAAGSVLAPGLSSSAADGMGLRDLVLIGAGPGAAQTGIALGGAQSTVGFFGMNINIANFGVGLQFQRGVWNFKMQHSVFGQNGKSVDWPSTLSFGGENIEFDHTTFVGSIFANSVEFNSGGGGTSNLSSLTFIACNFDDAQLVINDGTGSIRLYSPHFENPNQTSGDQPFIKISAFTAASDVEIDGPDFYNDSSNPYPPDFIELDGGPTVAITQMRSLNLDGSNNVPANIAINGDANLTLTASSPLRGAMSQYVVNSGNPKIWETGNQTDANIVTSSGPFIYTENAYGAGLSVQSPSVTLGGNGYSPAVSFSLWTGSGTSYYGTQIREGAPGELDFCSNGSASITGGTYVCNAAIESSGTLISRTPDGIQPISVVSHTPPDNLNAWPATFNSAGQQVINPHITSDKVILPANGRATIVFSGAAAFHQPPACTLTYQTTARVQSDLSFNPAPNEITVFGQPFLGVYFVCIGD